MDVMELRRGLLMQMASGGKMELVGQYTVPTSWENDTDGNGKSIVENVVLPIIQDLDTATPIYIETQGNTAAQYALISGLLYKEISTATSNVSLVLRKSGATYSCRTLYLTSTSTWCSAGTIIKVFKIN